MHIIPTKLYVEVFLQAHLEQTNFQSFAICEGLFLFLINWLAELVCSLIALTDYLIETETYKKTK